MGYIFGEKALDKFYQKNNLDLFIRGHDIQENGYRYYLIISLWSAPNFSTIIKNKASVLEFDEHMNTNIKIFESYPNDEKKNIKKMIL